MQFFPRMTACVLLFGSYACDSALVPMPTHRTDQTSDAGMPRINSPSDAAAPMIRRSFRNRTLYLVMPDRFADGDPTNNTVNQVDASGCYDPNNPSGFHGGDLAGLSANLDYLEELGVGAVWLTPVARQVSGCGYHGYWQDPPLPYSAEVDSRFGTLSLLAQVSSSLHKRDMHLVLDLVLNHTGVGAKLVSEQPSWFHRKSGCSEGGQADTNCPLSDLPDFAQELPQVSQYLLDGSLAWIDASGADGVRLDAAKHMPADYLGDGWFRPVKQRYPSLYAIAEVFSNEPASIRSYLDAGLSSAFNFQLQTAMVNAFAAGGPVAQVASVIAQQIEQFGSDKQLDLVNMLDNHDLERFASRCQVGRSSDVASERYRLALTALFTLPGIPQLTYGDELGMLGGKDPDNRRDMPAWAFDQESREAHSSDPSFLGNPNEHFEWVKVLSTLRNRHIALSEGTYLPVRLADAESNLLVFLRATADEAILVMLNNADSSRESVEIELVSQLVGDGNGLIAEGVTMTDLFGRGSSPQVQVDAGSIRVSMPARGMAAYRVGRGADGSLQ